MISLRFPRFLLKLQKYIYSILFTKNCMDYNWLFNKDKNELEKFRKEYNKKNKDSLNKKLFIFDQDGTLYIDNNLLNGATEFIKYLNLKGKKIIFISNNSSRSTLAYKKKLSNLLGISINQDQIYTSTLATIAYLKSKKISKIYSIGTAEFNEELISHGFELTDKNPNLIVLAFDTSLNYQKLKKACLLIQNGVEYVATHPDKVCPTLEGFIPDIGSFIALIKTATNKEPQNIFGKPNPELINSLLKKFEIKPQEAIIFGDRLYTDIKMGKNSNTSTALMLTGESKIKDLLKYEIFPDFIFQDLNEALYLLQSLDK